MAQTKEQKQKIVENLKEKINKQKSMVFVAIKGLKASDIFDFRKKLEEKEISFQVVKKTLLNIVFKEEKINLDAERFEGQLALVFGFKNELEPAKAAYNFSKENENLKILGGYFENKFKEAKEVISLAQIPSREELLARFVGSVFAPASRFVNIFQSNIRSLVCALSAIKK